MFRLGERLTLALLTFCIATVAYPREDITFDIVRCFFVYGPIVQVGKDISHAEIHRFGQDRMTALKPYIDSNVADPHLNKVFQDNLVRNKAFGKAIEETLLKSIFQRDEKAFLSVFQEAVTCDNKLGIATTFIPKL